MDTARARTLLADHLHIYRTMQYEKLKALVDQVAACAVTGTDGGTYQIEVEVRWDDETNGNIRVIGSVDDGGLRAFSPITDDFIMTPAGTFLGE